MIESYSEIEKRMFEKYKELTGCDCHDASDISIRIKLLAGELFNLQSSVEWIKNQIFPQTATKEQLDYHAEMRGLSRKKPTNASGVLRFSLTEAGSVRMVIPAHTTCSTAGKNPVYFVTDTEAVIDAGSLSTTVNATAVESGSTGNAAANYITVITKSINSFLRVTNPSAFIGGSDIESDDSLRKRILDDIKTPSTGTNKAYYKRLAESVDGVFSASVAPRVRGNGTINIYIAGQGTTLNSSHVTQVQELINSQRELNVDVLVESAKTARVGVSFYLAAKGGYDYNKVKQDVLNNILAYYSTLQVGEGLFASKLGNAIAKTDGVDSFLFTVDSSCNYAPNASQLIIPGNINIYRG